MRSVAQLCDPAHLDSLPPPPSQQRLDSTLYYSLSLMLTEEANWPPGRIFAHTRKQIAGITSILPLDCVPVHVARLGNWNCKAEVCVELLNIFLNSQWWKTPITTRVKAYGCKKSPLWIRLERILCWIRPGCLSPVFFSEKITASHLAIWDPHGWNLLLEDTVVINQPALSNRPPELRGMLFQKKWEGGLFCGEEMISVDGLSEAGSGGNRVSTALEGARGVPASCCPTHRNRVLRTHGLRSIPVPLCSLCPVPLVQGWASLSLPRHADLGSLTWVSPESTDEVSVEILFTDAVSETGWR